MKFSKSHSNRRQFLRNTSLAALSLGMIPARVVGSSDSLADCTNELNPDSLECDPTTLDLYGQGPFYTPNPPVMPDNQLAEVGEQGTRMIISGRVYDLNCGKMIPDAVIDVWHANDAGQYDNSGFNLRGTTISNAQGFYMFETVKPGKYLNGSEFRPSHIHFRITPPGFDTLTTQLYFEGDPDLESDAASSVTSGEFDATQRIISLAENDEGKLEGTWDISVEGDGITSARDIHVDKGIVYKASPNPFTDRITIKYGVFRKSKVSLLVYDMQGRMIANLEERELSPEIYEAVWQPNSSLPNGHYFIALRINDLQVHYLKVIRQG
jgi:protocatechuate 3,4-dioxygenase beta subunit